jgi:ABC-type transporter Mla MlaB component
MTTNNLIGYDPLAWMDGDDMTETSPESTPVTTSEIKSHQKSAEVDAVKNDVAEKTDIVDLETAEATEETQVVEAVETENTEHHASITTDALDVQEIDVDVSLHDDGEVDVEIAIETNTQTHVAVAVSVETVVEDVIDTIVEEAVNMPTEKEVDSLGVSEINASEPQSKAIEPLVNLEPEATIRSVSQLHETLKQTLSTHERIEIDASDVTTIDTATLQLLVSLKKDAARQNKTAEIIYPSARFIESAKLLGLLSVLDVTE